MRRIHVVFRRRASIGEALDVGETAIIAGQDFGAARRASRLHRAARTVALADTVLSSIIAPYYVFLRSPLVDSAHPLVVVILLF
jgi:hypothetical protein